MAIEPITEPATLWRSSDVDLDEFHLTLPSSATGMLVAAVRESLEAGVPTERLTADDLPLGDLESAIDDLADRVRHGRGFALVDGFPVDRLDEAEIERFFWGVGIHLGRPVSQSVMGERLGHIRDVTRTDPNARAYRNRSELTPHTDPADILSFLCLQPAAVGGVSRFVSAMTIHEEMRRTRPDLLARLYRGYRYHRLGEQRPGSPPITPHRVPVFSARDGLVSCRYVRQYLEVAADEDPSITLDGTDRAALALFEELAADPSLHHEFRLEAGQAVFANNFTVLHARSAFEDRPDAPARHLLRLWLAADPPRPVVPDILHFDGEPGIPPVEGRTPSYATRVEVQ
jgi:alpha-ketoglutarate-dependent taurine dioxygenase